MRIVIKSSFDNAKLRYTLDYIFNERLGCNYILNPVDNDDCYTISYCDNQNAKIIVPDSKFLHKKGVIVAEPEVLMDTNDDVLLFPSNKSKDFKFDVFAAVFFMLSRNEEYICNKFDKHGRFDCPHSFAYKHNFHQRAVVDEWIIMLRNAISTHFPEIQLKNEKPAFSLTIDIDQMFSYFTKGFYRIFFGALRDLCKGNFNEVFNRKLVFLHLKKDPFDVFDLIDDFSVKHNINPRFFILAALKKSKFDKNGNLRHEKSITLIKKLLTTYKIGLHPSYYCAEDYSKLQDEKLLLENISGVAINSTRFHYLRMSIPESYRQLCAIGIKDDYTMGFASKVGFRAGTSRPFNFFDLEKDTTLPIRIHPFCVMDGALKDYEDLSLADTEKILINKAQYIKNINGIFEILIHNETLSERGRWKGWYNVLNKTISSFYS